MTIFVDALTFHIKVNAQMLKMLFLKPVHVVALLSTIGFVSVSNAVFEATAELPPLLVAQDGSTVTTETEWEARRIELKALLQVPPLLVPRLLYQ